MLLQISYSCLPKQGSRSLSSLLPLTPALRLRTSISQQGTCGLVSHKGMQLRTSMSFRMGGIYRSLSLSRLRYCSMGNSSFCPKINMDNSVRLCWPNNVPSTGSSWFYSQVHTPVYKSEDVSPRAVMEGANGLGFKGFNKNRKKKKNVIAAQTQKSTTSKTEPKLEADDGAESPAWSKTELKSSALDPTSPANKVKKESKEKKRKELQERKNSKEKTLGKSVPSKASKATTKVESSAMTIGAPSSAKTIKNTLAEATVDPSSINDSSSQKKKSSTRTTNPKRKGKSPKIASEPLQKGEDLEVGKIGYSGDNILKKLYPPTGKSVVVVESVTKAKVIQGFLGGQYEVQPSYGHVRDLAARSGSVRPDDDFSMVWEVPAAAWTHLKSIRVALTGADNLILASDPDREGEAIAWHIIEMLRQQDALRDDVTVARVVFHEITESSVTTALQAPRNINANLVHAYLARRALDYLIGFNISPLLWRKLPGCQSAGRVQSAALSLICDREKEIDEFVPKEYWSIEVEFNQRMAASDTACCFPSHLTFYASKKLNQFSISSHTEAEDIEKNIKLDVFKVLESKSNKMKRNPPTPYITSTLQQDAANKLHFPASYTMKLAQKLYEGVQLSDERAVGLITYIRTDGLHISDEAVKDIRSLVIERFGSEYASETPRKYFKRVKNAQEAHEGIRPTDIRKLPSMLSGVIDDDSLKLYALIWSRTMACQMEQSVVDQIHVTIGNADRSIAFGASSSRISFPGYLAAFKDIEAEAMRNKENDGRNRDEAFAIISTIKIGDDVNLNAVELKQHFTQPPPRYSEGSLVKKLEELGIGRPSTYASTLKVLQDRNYVIVKSRMLHPEFRGRMVSAFLASHFSEVTDYSFTADMESELDNVSAGITEWKGLLKDYWTRFSLYCDRAANVHIHQVEKMLEKTFEDFLFSSLPDKSRTCPSCLEGTLIFKVSRFGAGYFIGCNQHPKCKYIAKTLYGDDEEEGTPQKSNTVEEPKLLGHHPASNEKVLLKNGPYGAYVQLGEDRKGYIPKRASISQTKDLGAITLEDALELLQYPLTLGNHPKDGQPVILKLAKVGFTIRHRRTIAPVPKNLKPEDITLEKALQLLSSKNVRRCGRPKGKPKVQEAL